jgi:hypothetical protein
LVCRWSVRTVVEVLVVCTIEADLGTRPVRVGLQALAFFVFE